MSASLRHVALDTRRTRRVRFVPRVGLDAFLMRADEGSKVVASHTKRVTGRRRSGRVQRVRIVTIHAGDSMLVHHRTHELVALHPVLLPHAIPIKLSRFLARLKRGLHLVVLQGPPRYEALRVVTYVSEKID